VTPGAGETYEAIPLEEARGRLRRQRDLGALPAAMRLWSAGEHEEVLAALRDPAATPGLRTCLLALGSGEQTPQLEDAARALLEEENLPREVAALCRALLARGGGGNESDE
jgi:hypothetical protein